MSQFSKSLNGVVNDWKTVIFHRKNLIVPHMFSGTLFNMHLLSKTELSVYAPVFLWLLVCLFLTAGALSDPFKNTHICLHVLCLSLSLSLDSYRLVFITAASQKEADDWLWGELLATINKREEESEEERREEGETEGGREWLMPNELSSPTSQSESAGAQSERSHHLFSHPFIQGCSVCGERHQLQLNVCEVTPNKILHVAETAEEEEGGGMWLLSCFSLQIRSATVIFFPL